MSLRKALARLGVRPWRTRHGWTVSVGRARLFLRRSPCPPRRAWLTFRCNICGGAGEAPVAEMGREAISCWNCGSTVRFRAVVRALSLALFGRDLPLPDFPRRSLRGLGLSDWEGYAASLEERLDYTNTFYHREPRLDIRRVDLARLGTLDFLVASDVFEHVPPPVSAAFENVWRLLKPGGAFVFTAPYAPEGETVEHFPRLYDYEIIREGGRSVLTNTTREGEAQRFEGLRFHGGSGESLEMRRFSRPSLLKAFHDAGFSAVTVLREPRYEHGIVWLEAHSFPIVARK